MNPSVAGNQKHSSLYFSKIILSGKIADSKTLKKAFTREKSRKSKKATEHFLKIVSVAQTLPELDA
ncbi:MAG: hypothetical protein WCK32_03290 [Chlorobiaceae bacterium]